MDFNVIVIIITNELFVYLFIYFLETWLLYIYIYLSKCRVNSNPWQKFCKNKSISLKDLATLHVTPPVFVVVRVWFIT